MVQAPIFCITEAKKQDVEMGTAQCAAQLIGAAQLNQKGQQSIPTLYGCSTTGMEWRFLRFEDNTFVVDETRYLINEPAKLLGVLQQILDWQLFAQRSVPLEGVYQAVTRDVLHILRFHRDGKFEEARGAKATVDSLLNELDTHIAHPGGGRYELKDGKLMLYFKKLSENQFPPFGGTDSDKQLTIFRYTQAEPVQFVRL
ncbi:hypothetical protein QMK33_22820 [Hymenobacter sp. H14-R3]|uniref:hypothetical protein n=1 Tax=Hymenobacter sp. H14-R3 TaxID=3046308 RepID=UPI0024BA9291|nr:hypothetical protein [Hymenobacter sp. H14-R3]MDJ0367985.1 hypothetical protein [Hymenobacter sp. H14-R3]